jgi:hypothetical protein
MNSYPPETLHQLVFQKCRGKLNTQLWIQILALQFSDHVTRRKLRKFSVPQTSHLKTRGKKCIYVIWLFWRLNKIKCADLWMTYYQCSIWVVCLRHHPQEKLQPDSSTQWLNSLNRSTWSILGWPGLCSLSVNRTNNSSGPGSSRGGWRHESNRHQKQVTLQ